MVKTAAGTPCEGLLGRQQRTTTCPPVVPDFHWIKNGKADDLEATLQKLCDARIRASVQDDICHDVVGLEVIQWDDHPSCGRCGVDGVDGGDGWGIFGVSGGVGAIGGCAGEGGLAFKLGIGG